MTDDSAVEQQEAQEAPEAAPPVNADVLSELRAEAKSYRLRLREAEKALAEMTEKAETATTLAAAHEAKLAEIQAERDHAQAVAEVAEATGVPAKLLRGATRDELEAHAEALKPVIDKANGPFIPDIGRTPDRQVSSDRAFVRSLFGGD